MINRLSSAHWPTDVLTYPFPVIIQSNSCSYQTKTHFYSGSLNNITKKKIALRCLQHAQPHQHHALLCWLTIHLTNAFQSARVSVNVANVTLVFTQQVAEGGDVNEAETWLKSWLQPWMEQHLWLLIVHLHSGRDRTCYIMLATN